MTRHLAAWVYKDDTTFRWALVAVGVTLGSAVAVLMLWPCIALCISRLRAKSRNTVAPQPAAAATPHTPNQKTAKALVLDTSRHASASERQLSDTPPTQYIEHPAATRAGLLQQMPQGDQQQRQPQPQIEPASYASLQHHHLISQSVMSTGHNSTAVAPSAPPPLPAGPIPLSAVLPVNAVRVGHLPPLYTDASAPCTHQAAHGQQKATELTVRTAAETVESAGIRPDTQSMTATAGAGQKAPGTSCNLAYAGSLNCWLPASSSLQQQQQQLMQLQPVSQQKQQLAAAPEDEKPGQLQHQHPINKLAGVLQEHKQSLGQLLANFTAQQERQGLVQQQTPTETMPTSSAATRAPSAELLPATHQQHLSMLPGLLKQLMPRASLSDLLHLEALLLLLLPPADSAAYGNSSPALTVTASAGDPIIACSTGLQDPAPAAAAEFMQQLAAALDAAYTAGMQVHAAAAAYYDPSEVVVRLQEYIQDNQQLLQGVFIEFDTDGDGKLSLHELSSLVTLIPQLQQYEQGLILAVAAQFGDLHGDGCLSLQELLGVTEAFRKHQRGMLQKQRMQQQQCL